MLYDDDDEKSENQERWLLTYSDLITLLMIFFVVMYAMSNVDTQKYEQLANSLNITMNGADGILDQNSIRTDIKQQLNGSFDASQFQDVATELQNYLNSNGLSSSVYLKSEDRGLVISLKDTVLFDTGNAQIKETSKVKLIEIGKILATMNNYIRVEGHTDNVPIKNNNFKSNWELSVIRATNVVQLFIQSSGIQPDKLSAVGYGEFRPIAENSSFEGKSQNRRVDIVIVNNKYNETENNKIN